MILFVNHPLINDLIKSSLFSQFLEHGASSLLNLELILELKTLFVQVKCLPGKSEPESSHNDVCTVLLCIKFVVSISPAPQSDRHEPSLEALNTVQ